MTTALHWLDLRGADLDRAQLASRWWVHADDTIGGWAIMPADLPPSSGIPAVATFLSRAAAVHIVELHNTTVRD